LQEIQPTENSRNVDVLFASWLEHVIWWHVYVSCPVAWFVALMNGLVMGFEWFFGAFHLSVLWMNEGWRVTVANV
jgi:hypothetical protein